jgi:hypothetical protein
MSSTISITSLFLGSDEGAGAADRELGGRREEEERRRGTKGRERGGLTEDREEGREGR